MGIKNDALSMKGGYLTKLAGVALFPKHGGKIMQQKTDATRILWLILFAILLAIGITALPNCSQHHPHEPPEQDPPDTVVIIDTLTIHEHHDHPDTVTVHEHHEHPGICDTVDITIEFTLIKDQSAPNIYAIFLNDVEVERIVISETSPVPVEVKFVRTFERFVIGRDTITIRKIEGSRAETIGSKILKMECST